MGAKISREECKRLGLNIVNPFFLSSPNIDIYSSGNPLTAAAMLLRQKLVKEPMKIENLTLEVLVRFRTNYKLALHGVDKMT